MRRHGANEVMELALDRGQVIEDVGVVELEVVQQRRAWPVVNELAALVEERGVVFVGFDDEGLALAQARRHAEVQRHAADQKARLQPAALEDPREHRGRRRLAMRAGHGEHMAVLQHVLGEPLRAARVRDASIEDRLDQRVAAGDDVADDEQIGFQRELRRVVAFDQFDAERAQLIAHRRVHAFVATGDAVTRFARKRREPAHEGPADAENVNVHASILGTQDGRPEVELHASVSISDAWTDAVFSR